MESDTSCEICLLVRPIVYCKADAAHLCLSCDARVHSANTVSKRHPRTLLCESCTQFPAYVSCVQHQMFMCRGCDHSQHVLSSQHQKKVLSSYVGCPSDKDFAALWGFDLNEFDSSAFQDDIGIGDFDVQMQSFSEEGFSSVSKLCFAVGGLPEMGSINGHHSKSVLRAKEQKATNDILQQIFDLTRLQINVDDSTSFLVAQGEANTSSSEYNELHDDLDHHLQHSLFLGSDIQCLGSSNGQPTTEPFSFGFSQMDEDCLWQFKAPCQDAQQGPQDNQELGVCDGLECFKDFSMRDIDMAFKNTEDLFGADQGHGISPTGGQDLFSSSMEKDLSVDNLDNIHEGSVQELSWLSSESNSSRQNQSSNSFGLESAAVDSKEKVITRHKEKMQIRRKEKQGQYMTRRAKSDMKRLVMSGIVEGEGHEAEAANVC